MSTVTILTCDRCASQIHDGERFYTLSLRLDKLRAVGDAGASIGHEEVKHIDLCSEQCVIETVRLAIRRTE